MAQLLKGAIAGLAGTIVLTLMMMMKKAMGVLPELDPVHMMAQMAAERLGIAENAAIGWVMHFGIGTVAWGGLFALTYASLPGKSYWLKGILFGVGAWLLMMIGPMPISGSGIFGLGIGPMAPVLTLVFHLVFGAVMGVTFHLLGGASSADSSQ